MAHGRNGIGPWVAALTVLAAMVGCTPLLPYRTEKPAISLTRQITENRSADCALPAGADENNVSGAVSQACEHRIREDADRYHLYFTEFDDQGWAYPAARPVYGDASDQIGIFVEEMQELLRNPQERISIVVFAHGWKHNAAAGDGNVKTFRKLLQDLATLEQVGSRCPRRVIGMYVGWRGDAVTVEPFKELSFWNRKETAQRVAQGDVRVLFSHLRALQDNANIEWNRKTEAARSVAVRASQSSAVGEAVQESPDPCEKRLRLSTAGHSFGGLIVYTSIAQALIRDVVDLQHAEQLQLALPEKDRVRPVLQREGDLVVVVNPAIEATRLEPLYRAVVEARQPRYHTPIFVSITSTDDWATKDVFPIGRWLSTRFDKYPAGSELNEKEANLFTFGHSQGFVTHDLAVLANTASQGVQADAPCAGWSPEVSYAERLRIEQVNLERFRSRLQANQGDGRSVIARTFCGLDTMQLTARKSAEAWVGNSAIWNVSTSKPIVNDHNDFDNPRLLEVLRQLYLEADDRSFSSVRVKRSTDAQNK